MRTLSKYSTWQIEMAVTASLLRLDLLFDKQIVEYTHYLLDNEYYDDAMLAIIDDDSIYPRGNEESFQRAISNLGFPSVTVEQARWIYTCQIINKHTVQPENYNILDNGEAGLYYKFEEFFTYDDNLQDVDGFTNSLYCVDEAISNKYMGYVQRGYNDPKTLFALKRDFFEICHLWLSRNQPRIQSIFKVLYA
ncbi:hypothetical protein ACTXKB_07145 [Psychrobacter aquimaris]|uniref:hypothetical protein n=1 Tax=Psychrobacter aquimaris TaxID=292733 RepID=UPI003FD3348B